MRRVLVIRHGATSWSIDKRLQGRADLPLSESGREQVRTWCIGESWRSGICLTSPLRRAVETAKILNLPAQVEPRLIEADWGNFEGRTLDELRQDPHTNMAAREAAGIDFCPPGGESPRAVSERILDLLRNVHDDRQIWIAHKGVRNACLIVACGWDMKRKPGVKLRDDQALELSISKGLQVSSVVTVDLVPK